MGHLPESEETWHPPEGTELNGFLNFRGNKDMNKSKNSNYEIIVCKGNSGRPKNGDQIMLIDEGDRKYTHTFTERDTMKRATMGKPSQHTQWMINNGLNTMTRAYHKRKVLLTCIGTNTEGLPLFRICLQ